LRRIKEGIHSKLGTNQLTFPRLKFAAYLFLFLAVVVEAPAQSGYQVVSLSGAGTISGTVQWSGPAPRPSTFPINKDNLICDPEKVGIRDLERLSIGSRGGVENTVVFLKNISRGKPMDIPEPRRFLDQKHCRYQPHILLVPQNTALQMKSSDAVLHTVHMDGVATYNLPFPFTNQVVSRSMPSAGLVNLKCNGGHVWMNAVILVIPHPYYAVTDENGKFELTDVPPGDYEIVAWHEGWQVCGANLRLMFSASAGYSGPSSQIPKHGERASTWMRATTPRSTLSLLKSSSPAPSFSPTSG